MIGGTMETDILGGLQWATARYWVTDLPYAPSLAIPARKDLIAEL